MQHNLNNFVYFKVFYKFKFGLVLLLSIVISRLVVLGIQYIGGTTIQIGAGLEASLIIGNLILITRISERTLKIKLRRHKRINRLIKKLTTANLIVSNNFKSYYPYYRAYHN